MDEKIIKAAGGPLRNVVKGVVLDASAEADAILRDANARREQALKAAYDEGYEAGLAKWTETVLAAERAVDDYFAKAEPELVRLAVAIAKKIVGEELRASPETIVSIVREALASARRERSLVIRVNPEQAEEVRRCIDELVKSLGFACELQVKAAPSVAPGGCVVESEFGVIDAQLDTQLRVIERALTREGKPQ
jgi:type III secretion protein L